MHMRVPAILCAARHHGETAVIARLLTPDGGLVAVYVAGGRGSRMRPVMIPGNRVEAEIRAKSASQLPWARVELVESRGPWLGEPLASAAIAWLTTLTAATLPERHPYPALYDALGAALEAVCLAPSAREWLILLNAYELLLLRELGYGRDAARPEVGAWAETLAAFDATGLRIARYLLADRGGAGKGSAAAEARGLLRDRLARIGS